MTPSAVATEAPQAAPAQTTASAPAATAPAQAPVAAPAAPEARAPASAPEVIYSFKRADGAQPDAAHASELSELARSLGVPPEQAQALYDRDLARDERLTKSYVSAWEAAAAESERLTRADPELGGAKYEQSRLNAKFVAEKYGNSGEHTIWDAAVKMGFDRDVTFLRFMNNIYKAQAEPTSIATGATTEPAARLYPNSGPMYEKGR